MNSRSRLAQQRWAERIAEQQRSGLSISEYCRQHGIQSTYFFGWRKRLREPPAAQFVEIRCAPTVAQAGAASAAIELRLSNGRTLVVSAGFDAQCLRALLAIAEESA